MRQPERTKRTRGTAIRAAVLLAAALTTTWSCCNDPRINLSRIADFLSGVIDLSIEVSFDEFYSITFDGDFAAWAHIPGFSTTDDIGVDLSAATYFESTTSFDMDFDAADEDIALIAADAPALTAPMIFVRWLGDKYTADKGVCYLGWVEGTEVRLSATWCGDTTGVMYCSMSASGQGEPSCDLCEASTVGCAGCSMDKRLTSCLPPKPAGSIDIDIDIDIDVDMDNGAETCGAP